MSRIRKSPPLKLPGALGDENSGIVTRMQSPLVALCIIAAALVGVGCGGGSSSGGGQGPPEQSDPPARLPARWHRVINQSGGFSLGLPPGWGARNSQQSTLVRSADGALAISVAADRSDPGRSTPVDAYLRQTVTGLGGYGALSVGKPTPLPKAHYPGVRLTASGRFNRTGVRQKIDAVAERHAGVGTFTLLFFRSAKVSNKRYAATTARIVRTLRSRVAGS